MSDINNKAQKLASAVYLITGFFSEQEPLRWRLRELATDLASDMFKDKLSLVKELRPLFLLAKYANLVSETNHSIIESELSKLAQELENPFSQMFFAEPKSLESALPRPVEPQYIKDKTPQPVQERVEERLALKDFGAVSVKKNSRQSIIIGLLKRKKEIMIKDVVPLVERCSEKTIQRELLGMVSSGILKKIGEKRWSRYSLA